MKDITEVITLIRFQLSQLTAYNKHHEFEHLTRHFARLRICSNILPATGPVSSGGDQGRDFESYRTYLQSTPLAQSTFLGLATDKKLVFACSLDKKIIGKIKKDITTICSHKEPIHHIYFFCELNIPVAKRHKLQDWTWNEFQTKLDIFDGQALSEQLSDHDVFWIAEKYLDISSEIYPTSSNQENTYKAYKSTCFSPDFEPHTYAHFSQIKYGLRKATFNEKCKPDLLEWIKTMSLFLTGKEDSVLYRKAVYEICVAELRGLNNLSSRKKLFTNFFHNIEEYKDINLIQDTVLLLSYASTARSLDHFDYDPKLLNQYTTSVVNFLNDQLDQTTNPGRRCNLLQYRGHAGLLAYKSGITPSIDIDESLYWWGILLDEVQDAPLFPLESFADQFNYLANYIGEDHYYLELTQTLDELLSKRSSGYLAAEKCRDRAITFYNNKKYLLAIKQLHKAKVNWFTAETLRGSALSMLILSDCYREIGLLQPAKYYALATTYIAIQNDSDVIKDLASKAMFSFTNICYSAGEWITFALATKIAFGIHHTFDPHTLDFEEHPTLHHILFAAGNIFMISNKFSKDHSRFFTSKFNEWPIYDSDKNNLAELISEPDIPINKQDKNAVWSELQSQMDGRPFSDGGESRFITWKASGITWNIEFENTWDLTAYSEEFATVLQIIIADLANTDLLLIPTNVYIQTSLTKENRFSFKQIPDNETTRWHIYFPELYDQTDLFKEFIPQTLTVAIRILESTSMLNYKQLNEIIERSFSEGLSLKTFHIQSYTYLYKYFILLEDFDHKNRINLPPVNGSTSFSLQEHKCLSWINTDGPGYSKEKADVFLKNRYEKAILPIKLSLKEFLKDRKFADHIRTLKQEGYLDWHILLLINNMVLNYRLNNQLSLSNSIDKATQEKLIMEFSKEETEKDLKVPVSFFTNENIKIFKRFLLGSIANTWDLQINSQTPDFDAIHKLLTERYHNNFDDIEHTEFFTNL